MSTVLAKVRIRNDPHQRDIIAFYINRPEARQNTGETPGRAHLPVDGPLRALMGAATWTRLRNRIWCQTAFGSRAH